MSLPRVALGHFIFSVLLCSCLFYIFIIYLVSSNKELIQLVISFEILITVNNMQLLENYSEFNSNRQYEEWSLMRQRDRWCALRRMKSPHLPSVWYGPGDWFKHDGIYGSKQKGGWCFPYLWDFEIQAPKAFLGPRLQTLEQESWVYIWEMLVSLISLKESAIGNENAQSVVPELLTSSIHYLFTKIIFFNCFIFGQLHLRTFSSSKIPIHPKFLLFGSRRAT